MERLLAAAVAETLVSELMVVLQPGVKEPPELMKSLFTPLGRVRLV